MFDCHEILIMCSVQGRNRNKTVQWVHSRCPETRSGCRALGCAFRSGSLARSVCIRRCPTWGTGPQGTRKLPCPPRRLAAQSVPAAPSLPCVCRFPTECAGNKILHQNWPSYVQRVKITGQPLECLSSVFSCCILHRADVKKLFLYHKLGNLQVQNQSGKS